MIDIDSLHGTQKPEAQRWLYFSPPTFAELTPTHQHQFLFLDDGATDHIYKRANEMDVLCGDDGWGSRPFSGGCYGSVEEFEYDGDTGDLKKWLYRCGIPFKTKVFLLPVFKIDDTPAIMRTWKMVVKYAETFFNSDNLIVLDPKFH